MTNGAAARWIALAMALAGALIWAIVTITPPGALPATAPATSFSAMRAFADVQAIAQRPHPVGSVENARVRTYLATRLRALGAEVREQGVPLAETSIKRLTKWYGTEAAGTIGHNVIGVVKGRDNRLPALLLMAHHDSVMGSAAAADDTIGLAAALETLRAIQAQGRPLRDVILLFTDGEEVGLDGSTTYFGSKGEAERIGVIINMEARGGAGRANMFETGPNNGGFMRAYADAVARPATNSLSVLIYDLMPNYTDYTVAKARDIPGFNFAMLGGAWAYHSPLATPGALDPASLQDMGDQVLALARYFAFSAPLPPSAPNRVFADVLGRTTLLYPVGLGWIVAGLSALMIILSLRRLKPSSRAVAGGAIVTVALLSHAALFLTAINALSGSAGADYYDRLAALPRLEIQAGLIIAALLVAIPMARRRNPRLAAVGPALILMWVSLILGGPLVLSVVLAAVAAIAGFFLPRDARGSGATLLLLAATILVQILLPTAAALFAWPLLLAALAMAARAFLPPLPAVALTTITAIAGLGHLAAQAHFIFLGVGAELPLAMVAILFPALPLLWPLLPDKAPLWLPAILIAAACAIALWVRLDPLAPSVPTYSAARGDSKTRD